MKGWILMIASVVKITWNAAHVYAENSQTIKVSREHASFNAFQHYFNNDTLFEFDPETKKILPPSGKFENLEDYDLPEEFYQDQREEF